MFRTRAEGSDLGARRVGFGPSERRRDPLCAQQSQRLCEHANAAGLDIKCAQQPAKQYGLAHPKFGRDLRMKINPHMPFRFYDVQAVEKTRLTSDELAYKLTPLTMQIETFEQAELFLGNSRAPQAHDL
jgi:hypothetical protein